MDLEIAPCFDPYTKQHFVIKLKKGVYEFGYSRKQTSEAILEKYENSKFTVFARYLTFLWIDEEWAEIEREIVAEGLEKSSENGSMPTDLQNGILL